MKTTFTFPAEKIAGACIFAAKDDIRYYLKGVCFERHGAGMVAVATDGHRLTALYDPSNLADGGEYAEGTQAPAEGFTVIVSTLELQRAIKAKVKGLPLCFEVDDSTAPRVVRIMAGNGTTVETKEIEGKFPDWRRVVPSIDRAYTVAREEMKNGRADPVGFNAEYLGDFAKLSRALNPKRGAHSVILYTNADYSVRVCIGDACAVCVLMPMRVGEVRAEWYYGPEPTPAAEEAEELKAAA